MASQKFVKSCSFQLLGLLPSIPDLGVPTEIALPNASKLNNRTPFYKARFGSGLASAGLSCGGKLMQG